jgi:hypothetical protein
MNIRRQRNLTPLLALVALLAAAAFDAQAIPCSAGSVTPPAPSATCQDGLDNNDFVSNPLTVNTENFFGFNDWVYLQKQNADGGALETMVDVGWTVMPTGSWPSDTGTWEFNASVWDTYEDVMIVLKSGNNSGTFFSGYLLDNVAMDIAGFWDTGDKDISHLSIYARGDDGPSGGTVPEPATTALIASGLLLGARRRRKRC